MFFFKLQKDSEVEEQVLAWVTLRSWSGAWLSAPNFSLTTDAFIPVNTGQTKQNNSPWKKNPPNAHRIENNLGSLLRGSGNMVIYTWKFKDHN